MINTLGLKNLGTPVPARKFGAEKPSAEKGPASFAEALQESKPAATFSVSPKGSETPTSEPQVENAVPTPKAEAAELANPGALETDAPSALVKNLMNKQVLATSIDSQTPLLEDSVPTPGPGLASGVAPGFAERPNQMNAAPTAMNLNAPPAVSVEAEAQDPLTRRVVWNEFMRKMGDLGISAEDVLGAFGTLSEKELSQPPAASVDKLVMALGLDGQQAAMAKRYFLDLVNKTSAKTMSEQFNSTPRPNTLAYLTEQDVQKRFMRQSLDSMNRSFFLNQAKPEQKPFELATPNDLAPEARMASTETDTRAVDSARSPGRDGMSISPLALGREFAGPTPVASPLATPEKFAAQLGETPSQINSLMAEMETPSQDPTERKAIDELVKNFTLRQAGQNPQVANVAATGAGMEATPIVTGPVASTASFAAAAMPPVRLNTERFSFANSDRDSEQSQQDDNSSAALATSIQSETRANGLGTTKGEFQAHLSQGPAQQPMAIPEVFQQAHLMVRDGGGAMKITLHPDGLGEVAMRVNVENGKVSVQMITESDEAKKLIERQIGELKSGLSANHLQVDSIKIDTAANLGRQMDQQYQEASRQQAHANLEQFRQDHQGWRRSFFETGSVNPYQSQGDAPRDARPPTATARGKNNARRLDLVA